MIPAAIVLLALVLRLLHVRFTARMLLADDAVFFEQHARAFLEAWRHLGSPQLWPLLRQAVDDASLQGILYPLTLSLVYWAAGGVDHDAAAAFQAALGAATVWLICDTGQRAFGRAAGVTAGLLAAVYPPLVLTAGLLLAEGVLAFVQALAAYLLVRGLEQGSWKARLVGGIAVGVLMLRPAFQYVGLLCLVGLAAAWMASQVWRLKDGKGRALAPRVGAERPGPGGSSTWTYVRRPAAVCMPYLAGLLVVAAPWLAMNGLVYGKAVWSRTGDAWQQVYWGIYPPNRGWWPPDSPVPPKYGVESLPNAWAAGLQIQPRDLDYLEAAIEQVRATPLQALATEVNKVYHGFTSPFNTYAEQPPLVAPLAVPLHRALAILGLSGLALWWRRPAPSLLLALLTLGVSLPFLVSHIDVRYTVPAALSATLFAGHAVAELWRRARRLTSVRELAPPLLAAAVVGVADLLRVPALLAVFSELEPLMAHRIHSALLCASVVGAGWAIGEWLGERRTAAPVESTSWWRASGVAVGVVSAGVVAIQALYSGEWHEWSATLRPGEAARQRIVLPPGWAAPPGARAEVRFYAQGVREQTYVPVVRANGREVAELGPAFAHGGPLRFEERIMATASQQGKARADVPQWYGVPLDPAALSAGAVELDVTLRPEPAAGAARPGWVRVWGDYRSPMPGGRRIYEGPAFHSRIHGADDSFHKFVATGHSRLWRRVALDSVGAEAALARDGAPQTDDLSDAWGRQTGEYRIRVLVFGPTGELLAAF